jgi:hypothetical protein
MKFEKYMLPAHWASALINDDITGLTLEESDTLDNVIDRLSRNHQMFMVIDTGEDIEFMWRHDASEFGVLACDVCEYTVQVA